ncbi:biopolymer transporter ExbD [Chitinophagaceae bacterium LB-8]|uniref:Biopolymer transporter ExbD n=1 Tax=Paraflavisolibacter caeni TaxID=2982496 RepID=A0A9X2XY44_9BACT|nr:biopolymer transporter ExbD [Paraflavisolibacter caeni]MCU7550951.1 biopolymer transporter ExbD [Paraflavisolibacter caeni]
MAQIQLQPAPAGKKRYMSRPHIRIDMTPMVDLGFLLITFFIFTSSMSESKASDLYLTAGDEPTSELGASTALTVLISGGDSIYYYNGKWEDAVKNNGMHLSSFDVAKGIGNIIRNKQKALGDKSADLMLLIKPTQRSTYNNLINVLDEVLINNVKKYAIMEPTSGELSAIPTAGN